VQVIRGVNSPQLMRSITEQLAHEHKVIEGTAERIEVNILNKYLLIRFQTKLAVVQL